MQENNDQQALCEKIARLAEEHGWNHDEFARRADLNRLTVRAIFLRSPRKLHNATVGACARALGVTVAELRDLPIASLLALMPKSAENASRVEQLVAAASQPELIAWIHRNPDRAAKLSPDEADELLSMQGTDGALTSLGVAHCVEIIERRRELLRKAAVVAGTEYLSYLETTVDLLFEKVQPYLGKPQKRADEESAG